MLSRRRAPSISRDCLQNPSYGLGLINVGRRENAALLN